MGGGCCVAFYSYSPLYFSLIDAGQLFAWYLAAALVRLLEGAGEGRAGSDLSPLITTPLTYLHTSLTCLSVCLSILGPPISSPHPLICVDTFYG
jgi:hypothetical protein